MSATHACPSCAWALRWAPEQHAWACDRCGSVFPAQQAAPVATPQSSGLAPGWQRPLSTNAGFGGSAQSAQPLNRTPSRPPIDEPVRPPSQPPVDVLRPTSQPGRPATGSERPPVNAGFGGSATAAGGLGAGASQFGVPAMPVPQAGGFGGSANAAQPPNARVPSPAPPSQPPVPIAPAPAAPTPGYGPGGYPSYTPPAASAVDPGATPGAKRSKRGLVIGVVAVAAIGAGVLIAVMLGKGGKPTAGLASADEVTRETLAAMTAGDVDRLVALIGSEQHHGTLVCEDGATPDLAKALAEQRTMLDKLVGKSKGLTVDVVKLGMPKTLQLEEGKEIVKGCKLTVASAMHSHELSVKVKYKDKPARDRTYPIMLTEIEGRWFLATPPPIERPGDCATAAKAMAAASKNELDLQKVGASARARLERATTQHCLDDAWTDEVITCFEDHAAKGRCKLPTSQADKLEKQLLAIITEDVKSREVPTVAETPTPPVEPTGTDATDAGSGSGSAAPPPDEPVALPSICEEYKVQIDKLAGCRRIRTDVRKAQRDRYDMLVEGWNKVVKKTEALYRSTEEICKKGVETLVDLRKTVCR